MTAAMRDSRASLMSSQTIWKRVAPRARICSRSFRGNCCMAARVMPMTMGVAMMAWAMMIAAGV